MLRSPIVRVPALLAGALFAGPSLFAQAPTRLDQIAVFAGASRVPEREAEVLESGEFAPPVDVAGFESAVRVYRVRAGIEDVVRFYQERLGARELRSEEERQAVWDEIFEGRTVGPVLDAWSVDLSPDAWAESAAGTGRTAAQVANAVRAAYTRFRTPFHPGVWLLGAEFLWSSRETPARLAQVRLRLEDTEAFEIRESSYFNETEIVISVMAGGAEGGIAEQEEEWEEQPARPMAEPTEAQLGVPLYPGARFDGAMSGSLSASDDEADYYVFGSADAPATVARFYEQRTGKAGLGSAEAGGVMFAVRGGGLFPDLGVTVQPNVGMFPGNVRSIITVRKRR